MRFRHLMLGISVVVAMACGGSQSSAAPAAPAAKGGGGGGAGQDFGTTSDGKPGWINRGSAAVTKDGKRVFYGVGIASGIKNPALLRTTADNRARAELAKVFEVFSASLMKDYMNSSGEQNVEQAVKTFSSMSLEGSEIVDHYFEQDGSIMALAALDLQKVMDGVRKAKELGAVKSYTEKVSVDDIFDKNSKRQAPPAAPKAVAGNSGGETAAPPASNTSSAKSSSGKKPGWIEGEDPNYPYNRLLCGVGFGPERTIAENGSFAALSRIFSASVASVSKDFMGAYSSTGAPSLEVQSSETLTKVATSKTMSGVELKEVWEDKGAKTLYALSCIDRAKQGRIFREQIGDADARAGRALEKANTDDKAEKLKQLSRAMDALLEREGLNSELRVIDLDGVGVSGPYSFADVAAALEGALAALQVGVKVDGQYEEDFKSAFIEGLKKRGYEITDLDAGEASGLDVLVSANVKFEGSEGADAAKNLVFARAVVIAEVKNLKAGKVITSITERHKEGHRSMEEAERKAVRKLAEKIVGKVGAKIDDAMKGR